MNLYRSFRALGMTVLLMVMAMSANAAEPGSADEWEFDGAVYLWGASIDAKPVGGDNIHISFSDIIDDLDIAMMGSLGARKDKWSLLGDFIYLYIEDEQKGAASLLLRTLMWNLRPGL